MYQLAMKLVKDASSIMGLMHYNCGFNASAVVSYFPLLLLCHLQLARLMWCPISPSHPLISPSVVLSSCFFRISFSLLFPIVYNHFPCLCRIHVSNFMCPFYLWCTVPSLVLFPFCSCFNFYFYFFYCAVGGRLSLYSFSRIPLIIPLTYAQDYGGKRFTKTRRSNVKDAMSVKG